MLGKNLVQLWLSIIVYYYENLKKIENKSEKIQQCRLKLIIKKY